MLQQSQTKDINRDEYNGWKNRETWLVNLWISNDQYLFERVMDLAESEYDFNDKIKLLEDLVGGMVFDHDIEASLQTDLITGALARADLEEILVSHQA